MGLVQKKCCTQQPNLGREHKLVVGDAKVAVVAVKGQSHACSKGECCVLLLSTVQNHEKCNTQLCTCKANDRKVVFGVQEDV